MGFIFYAGLKVCRIDRLQGQIPLILPPDWHVTVMYGDLRPTAKLQISQHLSRATVVSVEYWSKPNVTVLVLESVRATDRFQYYSQWITYGYRFIPHVTVATGNVVDEYQEYLGAEFVLGDEYIQIKQVPVLPSSSA